LQRTPLSLSASSAHAQEEALPPIQVACAAAWSRAHNIALREGAIKGWDAAGVREGDASAYDWTFTTPYGGSLRAGGADPAPQWQPVDERIDRTLLLARDPILFYDEATLYESELDDNGTMSLALKARTRARAAVASVHAAACTPYGRDAWVPCARTPLGAGARDACVLVCAAALLAARGRRASAVRRARMPAACG
jgi:hypothetical protein